MSTIHEDTGSLPSPDNKKISRARRLVALGQAELKRARTLEDEFARQIRLMSPGSWSMSK